MIILIICLILLISCLTRSHCMFNGRERYLRMNRETSWPEIWCWMGPGIPLPHVKKNVHFCWSENPNSSGTLRNSQWPTLWPSGRASLCESEAETGESRRGGAFGRIKGNEGTGRCLWHQWQDGNRWAMKEYELCPGLKSPRHVQWDDFITFLSKEYRNGEEGISYSSLYSQYETSHLAPYGHSEPVWSNEWMEETIRWDLCGANVST